MLKKLMITTALSGVMIGAAFAEGTPSSQNGSSASPPAATQPHPRPAPNAQPADSAKPADPAKINEASTPADSANKSADSAKPADAAKSSEASKPADTANKSTEMSKPAGSAKFINSQKSDQFLASNFKGTDVIGAEDKKIGDISDILFDKSGKIEAYVVSVGGFLGIGSKHVALEPSAFQVVSGDKSKNENDKLKVTLSQEELKQAANFEPYKAPQTTTGMGGAPGGGTRAPAGAPR
jgi:sporulation protein YlmC with PRC-barrel domain